MRGTPEPDATIMFIARTGPPVVFETLREVPEGRTEGSGPLVALATLLVVVAIVLRSA